MPKTKPHAFIHRIYVRFGLALALVGGLPVVGHAAYTSLAPPPGWSPGGGALATFQPPAASSWTSSKAMTDALLRQASATSKIRVGLAINEAAASRMIASRIGIALAVSPQALLFGTVAVGAALLMPELSQMWTNGGFSWNPTKQVFEKTIDSTDGKDYQINGSGPKFGSASAACKSLSSNFGYVIVSNNMFQCTQNGNAVATGYYTKTSSGTVVTVPYPEVQRHIENQPLPKRLPNVVWPLSWPVDNPVINPGTDNKPKPLFIPTGSPRKNPNYDPSAPISPANSPTLQPGVRIIPAPTADDPWRVDIEPVDRPLENPDPNAPELSDDPDATQDDKPKQEDQKSLCEKHPDILACAKPELDTPEEDIPKKNKEVTLTEENLFGGGSCPADVYFQPSGGLQQMKAWDWNQSCGYISSYVKPILILCCTFTAFMILVPGKTE